MSAHCPYLGLEGNRTQIYLTENPRHRCYVAGLPQRVGGGHQGMVCLTSGYRRCPRLRAAIAGPGLPPRRVAQAQDQAPRHTGATGGDEAFSSPATAADRPRYTDLRPVRFHLLGSGRRRWLTRTEGAVLSLMACIVCAILFVGYGIVSRVQIGPDLGVPVIARRAALTGSPTPTLAVMLAPTSVPALEPAVQSPPELLPASPEATLSPPALAAPTIFRTPTMPPTPAVTRTPTPGHPPASVPTSVEATLPPATPLPQPTLPSEAPGGRPPATSPPTRLVLPGIGLNVPVRSVKAKKVGQGASAKTVWEELPNAAGFHDTSAYPGNPGNTVINGHRDAHAAIFRRLDQVQVGDEIVVYVGSAAYPYRVVEILVLPETNATPAQRAENERLIGHMPEERLTLITHTPVGLATHRLLVIARPPE